jgi:hypothetical protein
VTGAADIGSGGVGAPLIALLTLLGLAGLAAAAVWGVNNMNREPSHWRTAPVGGRAADARLSALGRAAQAGADIQQTLAQRKATRTPGRAG